VVVRDQDAKLGWKLHSTHLDFVHLKSAPHISQPPENALSKFGRLTPQSRGGRREKEKARQ
jgi:hypothetical protein